VKIRTKEADVYKVEIIYHLKMNIKISYRYEDSILMNGKALE
jgi:hypothetical protein